MKSSLTKSLRAPFPQKLWGVSLLLAFVLVLTGCAAANEQNGDSENGSNESTVQVTATTGMIADVARNIGGERVRVTQLMGPGVDPHLYTATESDVNRLLNADIIFYNGLFLEARMEDVLEDLAAQKLSVPVATSVPTEQRLGSTAYEDQSDPHVWMDVKLWRLAGESMLSTLIEFDPEGAEIYQANADAYFAQMDELETYVQEQVARVPEGQRILVTAHDAFQYFAQGYDFQVFAPQGISTESEAGVEDIRRTIDVVVENNIPSIFVESSIPPDVVEAIVEGARARGHEIGIGGELFSDAMGADGTPEGTYIGMIRHNVETITGALSGE